MAYKGLPLFVEACEILRREGLQFGIAVVGEGDLGPLRPAPRRRSRPRSTTAGSDMMRWPGSWRRFDAVVLPNIEASQSGVAATALGHGVPVIATPAGGIVEQIRDGETGLLAESISAEALAASMRRFIHDPELRRRVQKGTASVRGALSIKRLLDELLEVK